MAGAMTENSDQSNVGNLIPRRVLGLALGFELGLGLIALALALFLGLSPWHKLQASPALLPLAVIATVPMSSAVLVVTCGSWRWAARLRRLIDETLLPMFSGLRWWGTGLVSLAAGIGEELLFRGVVQDGLSGLAGPAAALVAASLLFGLAHALTPAYFVITALAGLYLGGLYLATDNLLMPMLVHFMYDWLALAWLLARPTARA